MTLVTAGVAKTGTRFHAASKLVEHAEVAITADTTWQVLGGTVTSPSFFVDQMGSILGRIVGGIRTVGATVELRVVEVADDGSEVVMRVPAFIAADTGDVWKKFEFTTNVVPRENDNTYRLEARLNGATSARVRYTSVTLLELV